MTRHNLPLRGCFYGIALLSSAALATSQSTTIVVDTGQTTSYGEQGAIAHPSPGQPFHGQDSQNSSSQPSYQDNGDGTISDLNTGLMWQKSPDFVNKRSWSEAGPYADALVLGGHSDWRLPTIKELYSLMDFRGSSTTSPAVPYIDTNYFDFQYPSASSGDRLVDVQFWSSTTYVGTTMNGDFTAFGVNFADGRIKGYPAAPLPNGSTFSRYVRAVRGSTTYGINDFEDNNNGTVTDHATGLMWAQLDSATAMSWEDALAYGQNSMLAGHSDWRLPDAKELQGLVDYTRAPDATNPAQVGPAIDPIFDMNDPSSWCWSSTTHLDAPNNGWAVYVCFGLATGWMQQPPNSGNYNLINVHGAGAQRSDLKTGDPANYPLGWGPQGDEIRITNYARLVRSAPACTDLTISYCNNKVSSSGCIPTIESTGIPSESAASGFTVQIVNVEPNQIGIIFYSVSGATAVPFYDGLLCIGGPAQRTAVQLSGSTGGPTCGGILSLDMNAAGICATIGSGNQGYVQALFRDSLDPNGIGMSNALSFTVCD